MLCEYTGKQTYNTYVQGALYLSVQSNPWIYVLYHTYIILTYKQGSGSLEWAPYTTFTPFIPDPEPGYGIPSNMIIGEHCKNPTKILNFFSNKKIEQCFVHILLILQLV